MKTIKTTISADKSEFLIESLELLPGAIHSENGSVGFLLDSGSFLRFGSSDKDGGNLWVQLIEKDS